MADDVLSSPLSGVSRPQPRSGGAVVERQAGMPQLVLLLAASCLAVLGAVLLSPVLPEMNKAFASTPNYKILVPIVLTIPALVIGLTAPFAGVIVDRLNRKVALIVAMLVYAFVGTMPLYLQSLDAIIVSRVFVGVCEALIMTSATTLIADYWDGARRARFLSLQTFTAALSAVVFNALGGVMGAESWRTPFWLYLVALPLALAIGVLIWLPPRAVRNARSAITLPSVPWRRLVAPLLITLVGGVMFYLLITMLSYVLTDNGMSNTTQIGLATGAMSLFTALGSVAFGIFLKRGTTALLTAGFILTALGLTVVALGGSPAPIIVGAVVAGFGTGILLPTMLTWTVNQVTFDQRGRGLGMFNSALFIGEFCSPLLVAAIATSAGGDQGAIGVLAAVSLVMAVVAVVVLRRRPSGDAEAATATA